MAVGGAIAGGVAQGYAAHEQAKAAEAAAAEQAAASRYGADIQNQMSKRNLKADQALTGLQLTSQQDLANAYRQAYQQSGQQYGAGETELQNLYETAPEELKTLEQQALTGQAEELQQGTNQLQTALAQQGVRGGQAATQLRRGIGEMTEGATENIQGLIAQDAMQRSGEQRQYQGAQQQALQQFMLSPESAQYSQLQTPQEQAEFKKRLLKYENVK